ncbi:hypothetical protein FRC12_023330 [Ceratobasidium sp. 428]|nr:hypothetical protein FRC12_023330 [Ceratobasidium sp. 428]
MNLFGNLDRDTRLLFRADVFFNVNPDHYNAIGLQSFNLLAKPAFATTGHNLVYTSNNKAPLIVQKLLLAMGHPEDAASVEFGSKWFACGRCHGPRRTWSSLVAHFLKQADDWEYAQKRLPEVAKSDVVYNDIHDPGFGTTPLVKCLSPEEAAAWESKAWETAEDKNEDQDKDEDEDDENDSNSDEDTEDYRFACRLCMEAGIESPMSTKVENIFPHITKVHAISDLQNGDVDEPFDWVTENPYVCVLEEMGGMGWCLIDG